MQDKRNWLQKWLWETVGPPLYYCEECKLGVSVKIVEGGPPVIKRAYSCECTGNIIAPRTAVCIGKGGISIGTRLQIAWLQAKAAATGRNA